MGRPPSTTRPVGLFCGLAVVDVIQLVQAPPGPDDKIVALDQLIAAGGPATNAAVAFAATVLATINVFGGFAVTHRMLAMFRKD